MSVIRKKIWPEYFEAVLFGKKKCELRLNDFEISEGDKLVLQEYDPKIKQYTGRELEKTVTHVSNFNLNHTFWPKDEIEKKGLLIISME